MLLRNWTTKNWCVFRPHVISASVLPLRTGNIEVVFSISCWMLLCHNTQKIHWHCHPFTF